MIDVFISYYNGPSPGLRNRLDRDISHIICSPSIINVVDDTKVEHNDIIMRHDQGYDEHIYYLHYLHKEL